MVDPARLDRLLDSMATELAVLAQLAERDDERLLADPMLIRAIKYAFVVSIEAAIDVAEHVIASEGHRVPESFADAFAVLQEVGVLDAELAHAMGDAARFRNLLVHGYADVDDTRVLEILRTGPEELRRSRSAIAAASSGEGEG